MALFLRLLTRWCWTLAIEFNENNSLINWQSQIPKWSRLRQLHETIEKTLRLLKNMQILWSNSLIIRVMASQWWTQRKMSYSERYGLKRWGKKTIITKFNRLSVAGFRRFTMANVSPSPKNAETKSLTQITPVTKTLTHLAAVQKSSQRKMCVTSSSQWRRTHKYQRAIICVQ